MNHLSSENKIRKVTTKWTQRDGNKIRICDMSDRHLINTIRFLKRVNQDEISAAYSCLSCLQGEMAQFFAEQDIDRMEDTPLEDRLPIYGKLLDEAQRRELYY